jgi:peptidoglycan/LPS O-acetylase OafA/YrhL
MVLSTARAPVKRLDSLTSLRFVFAVFVFATHTGLAAIFTNKGIGTGLANYATPGGRLGVSFFFVLSGFVLTWSTRPGTTAARFWRGRFWKIYPIQVITWAAMVVLMMVAGQAVLAGPAIWNLFLLHAWVPHLDTMVSMDSPSWSLSCEIFFYAMFPLVVFLVRKIRPNLLWPVALVTMGIVLVTPLIANLIPSQPSFPGYDISLNQAWFVKEFPPAHLFEFVTGVVMAQIVMTGKWIRIPFWCTVVLLFVDYYVAYKVPILWGFSAAGIVPLALFVAATAKADIDGTATGLRNRVLVRLGDLSFAFYMVHWIVITYGRQLIFGATKAWSVPGALLFMVVTFAVALTLAWLLNVFVEQPAMRRWARPRARITTPDRRPIDHAVTSAAAD